jgi:RimJ/RimL family protein N-acetyltransferase
MHPALIDQWPLFALRITAPRLELRYLTDELIADLGDVAASGIHDPATMPFLMPWTDVEPPALQRNSLQWYWRARAELTVDDWHLPFAVIVDGAVVGAISVMARHFAVLRSFETGSWLGRDAQGRGLGKEMRRAALHLGFHGLGADVATTGAFSDNAPSLGVTRSLGYEPEGTRQVVRRGQGATIEGFRLTRAAWQQRVAGDDIEIVGLDGCFDLLGLS